MDTPTQTVSTQPSANFANFGRRLLASLLDGLLIVITTNILGWLLRFSLTSVIDIQNSPFEIAVLLDLIIFFIQLALNILYFVYFIGERGQTLGKIALGIKVVRLDTIQVPGYGTAALREILGKLVSTLTLGIGYLWMLWDPKRQTLHDKIAGTVVVRV
ncbi:RDD family protein [Candidatus Gottesmanbacteria bacterium]|nr:RDD family protein [Candidatus Gottesmanbacteria bacterium]